MNIENDNRSRILNLIHNLNSSKLVYILIPFVD